MEESVNELRARCIRVFESSVRKTEKAFVRMSMNNQSTTTITKRLVALKIGLAVLNDTLSQQSYRYSSEELLTSRDILNSMLPSMRKILSTSKDGSPQRTLLERRIQAFELVIKILKTN
ncbi:MAG: hypothetical protein PHU24_10360 [Sphaerochaetaceae bacterium]|jgi:hypothetical protein|nr:hypothetical protein [Sphaerochaetaceae bacterium]MDD2406844.1 hypothetical protein [Sphaerochaetaceae bacterium]MDD4260032.1 hypothetical protein [Sphaerochaetaceae bacterium]MDD4841141.1 hypothetical protein [Sphaerochaetaceae bacterium]MDD5077004.1 hypothetical protein [Sphaerochaetaceae bacterium]